MLISLAGWPLQALLRADEVPVYSERRLSCTLMQAEPQPRETQPPKEQFGGAVCADH